MPVARVNGIDIFYEDSGAGSTGETMVFSHGLLFSALLWEAQVHHLRGRYRCIAYDHRGQGRSADGPRGSADMETVYRDALALIDAVVEGPVHFCGLSMGGFVGLRLGARQPAKLRSLMLFDTTADPEPAENIPRYRVLAWAARILGVAAVAARVEPILFGRTFRDDPARDADRAFWRRQLTANRRSIYHAVNGVIERGGVYHELSRISAPTLVAVGDEDVATLPMKSERLHDAIRGSRLVHLAGAGHSSAIEQPARVNAAIDDFLGSLRKQGV